MIKQPARLYFECHVTIAPVFDDRRELAERIARNCDFRLAELLLQRRKEDTPERSKDDTFMTGRDKDYDALLARARHLNANLAAEGFTVYRTKIEDTLLDTKCGDAL